MLKAMAAFEKAIVVVLVILMSLVVLLATIDLARMVVQGVLGPPPHLMTLEDLLDTFGAFLLVLVGLELLHTIKAYLQEHVVHAEVVLLAAFIAVARKVIMLDPQTTSPLSALGTAAILAALAVGYYLFKRADKAP